MKLHIKNMVCNRCIMVVKSEFEKLGYNPLSVKLGEVKLSKELSSQEKSEIATVIESFGFSIIDDKRSRIIEQIKTLIVELVHQQNNDIKINLSTYLTNHINHDYNYITNLFSEIEGTTIEKYFIAQKIERVKELLVYGELTLSEIAFQLNYSTPSHLSNQFKKITGLTPKHFKNIKSDKRKPLDEV
ncbi:helix-turn-helix domain-containing protein [Geojedonia litorea]|uniref:Helix-turn-helix domain-containing protein n=1 Tax=Geojedonia litorea TaxID=1268269 RepID=A0ABV9N0B5_9FLAO